MAEHRIKILKDFANAIFDGDKNFEVRENDRGYQKGDTVYFDVINKNGSEEIHPIRSTPYEITYVLSGWGLKEGYVAFGIKEKEQLEE